MSGLILYTVNPRSLGALPEWLTALDEAERLGCNAVHLNPFHPVTDIRKNYHGAEMSGSLYAIRDHFAINPEFCGEADAATARAQLKNFTKMARAKKLRVLADLVFNHVAADHGLVTSHPQVFKRNTDGTLQISGPAEDPWYDVAAINYQHPDAWEFFLGANGYWLRLLDDYLDLGFNGLRCDAAQWVPQLVMEQAVNYALRREPDLVVVAETLNMTEQEAAAMHETMRETEPRVIYDVCYDDVARNWDGCDSALLNRVRGNRTKDAAYFGGLGFVDSHDFTPRAAELRKKYNDAAELRSKITGEDADKKIAAVCIRDYAIACFTNNSVMLNRGYQWCIENNMGPFREQVSAEFFKAIKQERRTTASPLTISSAIADMHKLRASLPAHVAISVSNAFDTGYKHLSAIKCDFLTHGDERLIGSIILLLNTAAELGPQPFPNDYWQQLKEGQSNAQKLQFGADRQHRDDISGVAILVIPGGMDTSMELNQGRKLAVAPAPPEPSLVA